MDRAVSINLLLTARHGAGLADSTSLVEAVRDGWWYSSTLDACRMLVSYITDSDLLVPATARSHEFWLEHARGAEHTWSRIRHGDYTAESNVWVRTASSACVLPAAGADWMAVGDSAMSHDPLSSLGVSAALRSGLMAGETLAGVLHGVSGLLRAYDRYMRHLWVRYLVRRRAYYALERRWTNAAFWRRRSAWPVPGVLTSGAQPR
jgi:hypothetical protein